MMQDVMNFQFNAGFVLQFIYTYENSEHKLRLIQSEYFCIYMYNILSSSRYKSCKSRDLIEKMHLVLWH